MSSTNIQSAQQHVMLKDIRPMMRKLDIKVIVLQQEGEPVILRDGCIIKFMVADTSGVMLLNVWGSAGEVIRSGDILRITEVESKFRSGQHYLATSRRGKIQRVGQDTFPFVEGPNFSEPEPGANIPPSRAARAAVAAGQAVGSSANQSSLSKPQQQQQQQQPYTNTGGLLTTAGLSISSSKQSSASGPTRQSYTNNGLQPLQPSTGQHHHWSSHRNHGDGWRSDGGKGRIMGKKGDDQRRSGLGGTDGSTMQRDPRKRNLDNNPSSPSLMTNDDSRSTRQKLSYNEFAP